MRLPCLALTLSGLIISSHAFAHRPHEHGAAELDIVVDGAKVLIGFEGPADNVFGFEHTPKTDAEKKVIADAMSLLRDPSKLFVFPAAAGCTVLKSDVDADQEEAMLAQKTSKDGKSKSTGKKHDDHAEIEAEWDFTCKASPAGGKLVVEAFFKSFPKMQKVKLQLIVNDKQSGRTLTPKDTSIPL